MRSLLKAILYTLDRSLQIGITLLLAHFLISSFLRRLSKYLIIVEILQMYSFLATMRIYRR